MRKYQLLGTACIAIAAMTACKQKAPNTQKFVETANMDSSVKPGDNFYLFVNGKWIKTAEIPATESGVGSFLDLYNRTKQHLKDILEDVSTHPQTAGSIEQKVGDLYASGMDSATIDKLGYDPIKPLLKEVDGLTSTKDVV